MTKYQVHTKLFKFSHVCNNDFGQLKQKVQMKINFPISLQASLTINNSLRSHKVFESNTNLFKTTKPSS